jgi:hypothetical protein
MTVHPTQAGFVGEHDPQPTTTFRGDPFGFLYRLCKALFFLQLFCASMSQSG